MVIRLHLRHISFSNNYIPKNNPKFMLKAVLFDLDNTLLDFFKLKKKASDSAVSAMIKAGLKLPLKKTQEELFRKYLKNIEGERVFTKFLKEKKQFDEKILAAGLNAYLKTKPKYLKSYPEVRQTLVKLKKKKIKLGLITNAPNPSFAILTFKTVLYNNCMYLYNKCIEKFINKSYF